MEAHTSRRKIIEGATAGSNVLAPMVAIVGAACLVYGRGYESYGSLALAGSAFLFTLSIALSFGIDHYRFIGLSTRGSQRVERMARWTRIKVAGILHNLLTVLAVIILVIGAMGRMGMVAFDIESQAAQRAIAMLVAIFAGTAAYGHNQTLRVQMEQDRSGSMRILFWVGIQLGVLVAAFAAYLALFNVQLDVIVRLTADDAPVLVLAAFAINGSMMALSRSLPSLFGVIADPVKGGRGGYASREKSVLMPTMVALTLMGLFLLIIIVFGAGLFSVVQEAGSNIAILVVLGVMALAVVVGVGVSFQLGRQEDKVELFKEKSDKETVVENGIILASTLMALLLLGIAFLLRSQGGLGPISGARWLDFASLGLLAALGPYGFYAAHKNRRIQKIELRFPDFLRDLASSHKGGLTLVQSVKVSARGEYGALSSEIQRLSDQLTWNVPFEEAFQRFAARVDTPLVRRSVNLVLEASRSGGSTSDVLLAAARDAREIKTLERERLINMSVYATVIYVTFFVFLFVVGVLVGQFLPEIIKAGEATASSQLQGAGGIDLQGIDEDDYRQFYFIAANVQAMGNGIMAGVMGSGRFSLGLRHGFIMVLITYATFALIL